MELPQIIAYVFFGLAMLFVTIPFVINKDDVWRGVKGDNNRLDMIEAIGLMWLLLFPFIIFTELFLEYSLPTHVWYSLDTIFLIITGGKVLNRRNDKNNRNASELGFPKDSTDSSLSDTSGEGMPDETIK